MIIGITGPVASGKSKAIQMLKSRNDTTISATYHDLDEYCKSFNVDKVSFFQKHFNVDTMSKERIIKEVFSDMKLYNEYCQLFEEDLIDLLNQFTNGIHIVEASALFSYPNLIKKFDKIICIDPKSNHKENKSKRKIDTTIFDDIYWRNYTCNSLKNDLNDIRLETGTLMELRSKIEQAIISIVDEESCINELFNTINRWETFKDLSHGYSTNPYHNLDHTRSVLTDLYYQDNYTRTLGELTLYHDFQYDPKLICNEDLASNFIKYHSDLIHEDVDIDLLCRLIRSTDYKVIDPKISNFFLSDISHWIRTDEEIIEVEQLMFKEYQHIDWVDYRAGRIKILNGLIDKIISTYPTTISCSYIRGIELSISWLNTFNPKIGWFCGSFNPFTIGHMDVLTKAERLFDKVVLVQGVNPNKDSSQFNLNSTKTLVKYEQHLDVKCIPDLIQSVGYQPILIRGIRNVQDYNESSEWHQQIKEFVYVDMVLIDSDLRHISSSFVRGAGKLNLDTKRFIVK
jgi:pantetheine-phosphate adenylyltransferase